MNYEEYEKKAKENQKRNEKFLDIYKNWLKNSKTSDKTIRKHVDNMDLYLNDYLNYYENISAEEGIDEAYDFLNDWFIRKCLFATKSSLLEFCTSIKKFYKCMCEYNYIKNEDYEFLVKQIGENKNVFLRTLEKYDEMIFNEEYDLFGYDDEDDED